MLEPLNEEHGERLNQFRREQGELKLRLRAERNRVRWEEGPAEAAHLAAHKLNAQHLEFEADQSLDALASGAQPIRLLGHHSGYEALLERAISGASPPVRDLCVQLASLGYEDMLRMCQFVEALRECVVPERDVEKKTKRLQARIPSELARRVEALADESGCTVSAVATHGLRVALENPRPIQRWERSGSCAQEAIEVRVTPAMMRAVKNLGQDLRVTPSDVLRSGVLSLMEK